MYHIFKKYMLCGTRSSIVNLVYFKFGKERHGESRQLSIKSPDLNDDCSLSSKIECDKCAKYMSLRYT